MLAWRGSASKKAATRDSSAADGFAAVDALVALTILATTIALSLEAATTAAQAAAAANEVRQANTLLQYLLQSRASDDAGRSEQFAWRVEVKASDAAQAGSPFQLCRHAAVARGRRSGRSYALVTLTACPAKAAS